MGGRSGVSANRDGGTGCSQAGTKPATGTKAATCGIDVRQPAPRHAARSQPWVPQLPGDFPSGDLGGAGIDMASQGVPCAAGGVPVDAVAKAALTDWAGAAIPGNTSASASMKLRVTRARSRAVMNRILPRNTGCLSRPPGDHGQKPESARRRLPNRSHGSVHGRSETKNPPARRVP